MRAQLVGVAEGEARNEVVGTILCRAAKHGSASGKIRSDHVIGHMTSRPGIVESFTFTIESLRAAAGFLNRIVC